MIIFDLDQTLADTSSVEALRQSRRWSQIMSRLCELAVYDGITPLLARLHNREQPLAIVTKSPDLIAKGLIKLHNWPIDIVIGHHQVSAKKPDPEGLLLAMREAGATPQETFHVGDQPDDTIASRAAGVTAIGAGWGISKVDVLASSKPDYLFDSVNALADYFRIQFP